MFDLSIYQSMKSHVPTYMIMMIGKAYYHYKSSMKSRCYSCFIFKCVSISRAPEITRVDVHKCGSPEFLESGELHRCVKKGMHQHEHPRTSRNRPKSHCSPPVVRPEAAAFFFGPAAEPAALDRTEERRWQLHGVSAERFVRKTEL